MDALKKLFPFSFNFTAKDTAALIKSIIIYVVADVICGFIIGLLGKIPLIGLVFGIVGSVLGIYFLAGLILAILNYAEVIK